MLALIGFLSGCAITSNPYNEPLPIGFPYYGFLPGDDFKIYDSQKKFDFANKTIGFELIDARGSNKNAQCIGFELDRNTELEGNRGMGLVSEYFGTSLQNTNAKFDLKTEPKLRVEVEGLSFKMEGFGQITIHGVVQLKVSRGNLVKTYCVDLTDKDNDPYSPLKWYSFDTRVGACRKMVSAAIRKAVDQILEDLVL